MSSVHGGWLPLFFGEGGAARDVYAGNEHFLLLRQAKPPQNMSSVHGGWLPLFFGEGGAARDVYAGNEHFLLLRQAKPTPALWTHRQVQQCARGALWFEKNTAFTYGDPRGHHEIVTCGDVVSKKTVANTMKVLGIQARPKKKLKVTTERRKTTRMAPNWL